MKKRIKTTICMFCALLLLMASAYTNSYYKASEEVMNTVDRAIELNENALLFKPQGEAECGLIFYPGGKVEYTAYATLMEACSKRGILCVLVKMPWNLAVFDVNAAEGIQEQFPNVKEWYMSGHSLGGAMAASYIDKQKDEFEGLILLASYSTKDLSDTELKVLSIYGTEDQILDKSKYEEYKLNFPADYREEILVGGCHAYFGDYGEQEGDGVPQISVEEQQKWTVDVIEKFIK